jgi:phage gpG-like protein
VASPTGDTKQLQELRRRMAAMKTPAFKKRFLNVIGQEALFQSLMCFEKSRDPYGNRWKPLKMRAGQPLLDTGRLRNSLNVRVLSTTSLEVATDVKYARLHQFGGTVEAKKKALSWQANGKRFFARRVRVPARPYLPDSRGVPRSWAKAFNLVAGDFVQAAFGRRVP